MLLPVPHEGSLCLDRVVSRKFLLDANECYVSLLNKTNDISQCAGRVLNFIFSILT